MSMELINEQMKLCIQQLDGFDQLSTNYAMTVIGFIGVVMTAIMAMLGTQYWLNNQKKK